LDNPPTAPETDCNYQCAGSDSEICGGSLRLSMFVNPNWAATTFASPTTVGAFTYQGCYVDSMNPRALPNVYRDDAMTPLLCSQHCSANQYFGLEFGEWA